MTVEIQKVLVLSTAHVAAALAMPRRDGDPAVIDELCVMQGQYGWLVHASSPQDNMNRLRLTLSRLQRAVEPSILENFVELLFFAKKQGCDFIRFDADGPKHPSFPVFDW